MENVNETTGTTNDSTDAGATLVVVSKIKKFIKDTSGMNTAGDCADALSTLIASELARAIDRAKTAGRKTVMARDINTQAQ